MAYLIWESLWHTPEGWPPPPAPPAPVVVFPRAAEAAACGEPGPIPLRLITTAKACDNNKKEVLKVFTKAANLKCFEFVCYSEDKQQAYVKAIFPDWSDLLFTVPERVKQNIFRFMVLYNEGGFFIEDDVELYKSFPTHFEEWQDRGLIIGWGRRAKNKAFDAWCTDYGAMFCNSVATWAFGAKKKHPALKAVIDATQEYWAAPPKDPVAEALQEDGGSASFMKVLRKRDDVDLKWEPAAAPPHPTPASSTDDSNQPGAGSSDDGDQGKDSKGGKGGKDGKGTKGKDDRNKGNKGNAGAARSDEENEENTGNTGNAGAAADDGQNEENQGSAGHGEGQEESEGGAGRRLKKHKEKVKVLGIEAFGCGQLHSDSPQCSPSDPREWLNHHNEGGSVRPPQSTPHSLPSANAELVL